MEGATGPRFDVWCPLLFDGAQQSTNQQVIRVTCRGISLFRRPRREIAPGSRILGENRAGRTLSGARRKPLKKALPPPVQFLPFSLEGIQLRGVFRPRPRTSERGIYPWTINGRVLV